MKKLLTLFTLLTITLVSKAQVNEIWVEAWELLEAKKAFVMGYSNDTLRASTQINNSDTTILTLGYANATFTQLSNIESLRDSVITNMDSLSEHNTRLLTLENTVLDVNDSIFIYGEIPIGIIDSLNQTFLTKYYFRNNSTVVHLNSIEPVLDVHYSEVGDSSIVFVSGYQPLIGEYLRIDYKNGEVEVIAAKPPEMRAFAIPTLSTSQEVSITTFTASDNTTGFLITESSSTPAVDDVNWSETEWASYTFSTDGSKHLYAWVKDVMGRISASLGDVVIIDSEAPVVTAFVIPSTYTELTVPITTFTATDNFTVTHYLVNESASTPSVDDPDWYYITQTEYTFDSEGVKILYAWVKDDLGNISSVVSDTVDISLP